MSVVNYLIMSLYTAVKSLVMEHEDSVPVTPNWTLNLFLNHFNLIHVLCFSEAYLKIILHHYLLLLSIDPLEGSGMASRGGNTTLSRIRGRSDSCYPALGFTICNITTQSTRKSSEVIKYMMGLLILVTDPYSCHVIHTEISARE
jgi:hypothetical protein